MDPQDRYQFQTRWKKLCRWLRHRPVGTLAAAGSILAWLATGARVPEETFEGTDKPVWKNRRAVLRFLWNSRQSIADVKMGRWSTIEECMQRLRERA